MRHRFGPGFGKARRNARRDGSPLRRRIPEKGAVIRYTRELLHAMQRFEFAILGAGAMGSILGAHLARAGHTVAMLARGRRAEQVRSEGLRVSGVARFSAPIQVIDDRARLHETEVLIVATKAIGTAESLQPLAGAKIG